MFEYMFEYHGVMDDQSSRLQQPLQRPIRPSAGRSPSELPLKAMSPGVVEFLFRQLVTGRPAEDTEWRDEGILMTQQEPGAELARRLAESDVDALTPTELFEYVRAAQSLVDWAEGLRRRAVDSYCANSRTNPGAAAF